MVALRAAVFFRRDCRDGFTGRDNEIAKSKTVVRE
jgi:hypothetical protein